jgi:hypothetical protein
VYLSLSLLLHSCICLTEIAQAPSLISPSNQSITETRRPSFSWVGIEGVETFTLQLDRDGNFSTASLIVVDGIETSTFTPNFDLYFGRWFWRVRAVNGTNVGPFSSSWDFTIIPPRSTPSNDTPLLIVGASMILIVVAFFWNRYRTSLKMHSREQMKTHPPNIKFVACVMGLCTFLSPFALRFGFASFNIIAVSWSYWIGYDAVIFNFLNPQEIIYGLVISMLQFLFAYEVVRYCKGQALKRTTLYLGIASQIPIMILGIMSWFPPIDIYSGPLPLLLIVGYILMRTFGPKEPTSPWA